MRTSRLPKWEAPHTPSSMRRGVASGSSSSCSLTALATLVIAVLQSSTLWLGITIIVDMAVGGYVAMILTAKQPKVVRRAPVVPIQTSVPDAPTTAADLNVDSAPPTVRVIAG